MPTREHKLRSIGKESEINWFFLTRLFEIIMKEYHEQVRCRLTTSKTKIEEIRIRTVRSNRISKYWKRKFVVKIVPHWEAH